MSNSYGVMPDLKNQLLVRIARAGCRRKSDLYLSVYGSDRRALLVAAILRLPPGVYTLSLEGRAAPSLQQTITAKYGFSMGMDVTERLVRGLAVEFPRKIQATFTHGLQEITIYG